MIKSSDWPHHQSFFETLQLYWFYFRPWVFKRFDLFMISASWQVHSMPDLKCTKVPFQLCAKIHRMCVGRSHKKFKKNWKIIQKYEGGIPYLLVDFVFSIQIMWRHLGGLNLRLAIKKTACKVKTSNFERKYSPWYRDMICTGNTK